MPFSYLFKIHDERKLATENRLTKADLGIANISTWTALIDLFVSNVDSDKDSIINVIVDSSHALEKNCDT